MLFSPLLFPAAFLASWLLRRACCAPIFREISRWDDTLRNNGLDVTLGMTAIAGAGLRKCNRLFCWEGPTSLGSGPLASSGLAATVSGLALESCVNMPCFLLLRSDSEVRSGRLAVAEGGTTTVDATAAAAITPLRGGVTFSTSSNELTLTLSSSSFPLLPSPSLSSRRRDAIIARYLFLVDMVIDFGN